MALNSFEFLFVFLPIVVSSYWILHRYHGYQSASMWLVLSSFVFFLLSSVRSLIVLSPFIFSDYFIAKSVLAMDKSKERERSRLITVGIIVNVGYLCFFKYWNSIANEVASLVGHDALIAKVALPLGISFLTFQKISFLCDVSSGKITEVRIGEYLLFALFFPKAVAGPIVHYNELVTQTKSRSSESFPTHLCAGFCLFAFGLFKKCVISDGVAQFVDRAFSPSAEDIPLTFIDAWVGVLAYTFQLYFDFSGYSDMALGAARMLGIRLPMNFNSPLKATSVVEYWGRWHITLTRFLTWYVYVPLVRKITRARASKRKLLLKGPNSSWSALWAMVSIPTIVTMMVSGLWHGVGWQFVIWGLLQGSYLTVNQIWRMIRPKVWTNEESYRRVMNPVGWMMTFLAVVFALVFFRSSSPGGAISVVKAMIGLNGTTPHLVVLAHQAGYTYDWLALDRPLAPLMWIGVIFIIVLAMPNSLEVLRRFRPALDFPPKGGESVASEVGTSGKVSNSLSTDSAKVVRWLAVIRQAWDSLRSGVFHDHLTAVFASILFVLGTMAIGRAVPFIYGAF